MTDFPHADLLRLECWLMACVRLRLKRDASVRQLGKNLGYSQAVVLSHMANGRVPIPLDRALTSLAK